VIFGFELALGVGDGNCTLLSIHPSSTGHLVYTGASYWDGAASIIPRRIEPSELDPDMRALIAEGLIREVRPEETQARNSATFDSEFIYMLQHSSLRRFLTVSEERMPPPAELQWSRVHQEKASRKLFDEMRMMGLAYRLERGWWQVEERTAGMYMAYLAGSICRDNPDLFPVTDTHRSLSDLTVPQDYHDEPLPRDYRGELLPRDYRGELLQSLKCVAIRRALPAPSGPISPSELVSFKRAHEGQLRNLHNYLNNALSEMAAIPNEELRKDLTDNVINNISDEVRVLSDQMSKKWSKIVLNGVAAVVLTGLGVGAIVASGGAALGIGLGVAAAAGSQGAYGWQFARGIRFQRTALDKPLAYAALVKAL
jgi:hypothetical protein